MLNHKRSTAGAFARPFRELSLKNIAGEGGGGVVSELVPLFKIADEQSPPFYMGTPREYNCLGKNKIKKCRCSLGS